MFSLKSLVNKRFADHYVVVSALRLDLIKISTISKNWDKIETKPNVSNKINNLESVVAKYESKLLYNSVIEGKRIKLGYKKNNAYMIKTMRHNEKLKDQLATIQPLPLSLKLLSKDIHITSEEKLNTNENESSSEEVIQFPYSFNKTDNIVNEDEMVNINETTNNGSISDEISQRSKLYKDTKDWMTAYDNFENDLLSCDEDSDEINYGTPDPNSKISNIPCGGCGALLHCKDTGIPGYIPSEIYKNYKKKGAATLQAMICQRCYFLNEYNLALQVSISPEDYPKILSTIREKSALVLLMVDMMDFPCSIWPGIADIFGPKTPIMVVGNKIDLLPRDDKKFLNRVKQNLLDHIRLSGFATSNILDVALISAKSGFGVEDLITSLQSLWRHKGDVYLVGCTNVGKSSLFNALLQSDYCKIQASDLIQRATISQWPGTTLNMLKFPIMRPTGQRLYLRSQRMMQEKHISSEEKRLREEYVKTWNSPKYATLIGRIGQTYVKTNVPENEAKDCFAVSGHANASGRVMLGINEKDPKYVLSRWCFDTPGVVQPDQIIHLLTIEELMDTIPKQIIRPETFCVKPGTSLFIAGLARLDYLHGPGSVRLTVFRSNELPITLCKTEEANQVYEECLGSELLRVPVNGVERLSKWPGLESSAPFIIRGTNPKMSCNDVVLSSAGWVAINCLTDQNYEFQAWTPERRGIYIRDCLLPKAVTLRGRRIRESVAYKINKFI